MSERGRDVSSTNQAFAHAIGGNQIVSHPLAYINDIDLERVRELVAKLAEIRKRPGGAESRDYEYWRGYLRCYCEQNAIPSEAVARIWEEPS